MKNRVDFQISEWYYKQAVADTTAKNTIRYHVLKIKKLKKLLDKDETKWYLIEVVAKNDKTTNLWQINNMLTLKISLRYFQGFDTNPIHSLEWKHNEQ